MVLRIEVQFGGNECFDVDVGATDFFGTERVQNRIREKLLDYRVGVGSELRLESKNSEMEIHGALKTNMIARKKSPKLS